MQQEVIYPNNFCCSDNLVWAELIVSGIPHTGPVGGGAHVQQGTDGVRPITATKIDLSLHNCRHNWVSRVQSPLESGCRLCGRRIIDHTSPFGFQSLRLPDSSCVAVGALSMHIINYSSILSFVHSNTLHLLVLRFNLTSVRMQALWQAVRRSYKMFISALFLFLSNPTPKLSGSRIDLISLLDAGSVTGGAPSIRIVSALLYFLSGPLKTLNENLFILGLILVRARMQALWQAAHLEATGVATASLQQLASSLEAATSALPELLAGAQAARWNTNDMPIRIGPCRYDIA